MGRGFRPRAAHPRQKIIIFPFVPMDGDVATIHVTGEGYTAPILTKIIAIDINDYLGSQIPLSELEISPN